MTNIGLYVHIPFCRRRCGYCAFATTAGLGDSVRQQYLHALGEEIRRWQGQFKVGSLFFGGGTPSLLEIDEWNAIITQIKNSFEIDSKAERTLEAHPATLTGPAGLEKLQALIELGFNRISLGIESFSAQTITKLSRDYNTQDVESVLDAARRAGFKNINLDLIFGWPWENEDDFEASLKTALAMNVEHLSLYPLSIEPGTPFETAQVRLNSDLQARLFMRAHEMLSAQGWDHYEIANYARPGFRCQHNLKYWNFEDYLGLGNSAASKIQHQVFVNEKSLDHYMSRISSGQFPFDEPETLDASEDRRRRVIMQLRLHEGVLDQDLRQVAPQDSISCFEELGYLITKNWRARLSPEGWLVAHQLMSAIA